MSAATPIKGHLGQSKPTPLWNPWYRNRTQCLSSNPYKGASRTKQIHISPLATWNMENANVVVSNRQVAESFNEQQFIISYLRWLVTKQSFPNLFLNPGVNKASAIGLMLYNLLPIRFSISQFAEIILT